MASMELRPHTGEATTRQRLLIPAFIHLRPSPTRFPQPSLTRSGAESPGTLQPPAPVPGPPVGERSPTGDGVRRVIHSPSRVRCWRSSTASPDDEAGRSPTPPDDDLHEPHPAAPRPGPLRLSWVGPTVASWL